MIARAEPLLAEEAGARSIVPTLLASTISSLKAIELSATLPQ